MTVPPSDEVMNEERHVYSYCVTIDRGSWRVLGALRLALRYLENDLDILDEGDPLAPELKEAIEQISGILRAISEGPLR